MSATELPVLPAPARATRMERPEWLKVRLDSTGEYEQVRSMMRRLSLVTVCEEARCPNIHECWARERTATFMLMGDVCTRHCGFCAVGKGNPGAPPDPGEPERVAEAARELGLSHAVVTSVNRDDLPDGGAAHFAATIRALRMRNPGVTVEVLVPDFQGNWDALDAVLDEAPEILNHNVETVPRLYRRVRPDARYPQSLELISRAAARRDRDGLALKTKSGVMAGLGESADELLATLADLRAAGCDIATVGQYLQPYEKRLPVERYYTPAEFEAIRVAGEAMGFVRVEAGPLVRSSYHARRALAGTPDGAAGATPAA
ncbi:MAG TPA: lipoyl synthase [Thermoanaerobaculia bacterium]|nr:lipoyl synthase [Thermoanaerobaculia bacterium]